MEKNHPRLISFSESEWAFHKVPNRELAHCARWELARLSGKKQKPWMNLSDEEKAKIPLRAQGSLQEIPASVGYWLNGFLKREYPALRPITFLIDFQEDEPALIELFKYWLKAS